MSAPRQHHMIMAEHLPFDTDGGIAERAAIGLIVLATDYTIEHEWRRIMAGIDGVALYHSRILNDDDISVQSLKAMEPRIPAAAGLFLPGGGHLDVIAYGCTSASMAIGEQKVFEHIRKVRPDVKCTTPITAAFAALTAFGARRIGVLTPYAARVNAVVADYIRDHGGFDVPVFGSFNQPSDAKVARITPASVRRAVAEIRDLAPVDAVFVSCTSVRMAEDCAAMEAELALPVTSSNHAMAWHALRLGGITQPMPRWGKLFELDIPS